MTTIDELATLSRLLVDLDAKTEEQEEALKAVKEQARQLREETIPSVMQELGLSEIKLATGQKLTIKQEVYASISADNKARAFSWLEGNGFGGLIKVNVTTAFSKGQSEDALKLYSRLQTEGENVSYDQSIHPQTLKAFLREQISKGSDIPLDLFQARPVWQAKISNP